MPAERPLSLDAAEWDARDRELGHLMREIEKILPYPMGKTERPFFEQALTIHLGGVSA